MRRVRTLVAGVLLSGASVVVLLDVDSADVASSPATTTIPPTEVLAAVESRPVPVVQVLATGCQGRAYGSGVLLDGGRVLTARHVVADADEIVVQVDGAEVTATVLALDGHGRDAALLAVPALDDRAGAAVATDGPAERMPVVVWGHPQGSGLASRIGTLLGELDSGPLALDGGRVQTIDAYIEEGMSGGPVVDARGSVVGVAIGYEHNTRTGIAVPVDDLDDLLDGVGLAAAPAAAC